MTDLDPKTTDVFAGKVVRKDLVRKVKVGANVPVYVLEYLIGKYCATDDPAAIGAGLRMVNRTIAQNFIRPDEANKAQFQHKDRGKATFIDKVRVRALEDKDWAEMANFGNKYLHVPDHLIRTYPRILELGVWAQVDLEYRPMDDEEHGGKGRPFYITDIRPIQLASFDFEQYVEGRRQFTTEEWTDLIIRSVGLEPSYYDRRLKLLFLMRLVPMAERNYNLIELGPRGTGKSFVYRETSPNSILISGGKTTVAQLFAHMGTGRIGLVGHWDVVAFDEVAGIQFADSTVIQIMKDYMESGSFARGKEELPAEASMVFLGNLNEPPERLVRKGHLFVNLPDAMIDAAFLDRMHFYLPGWDAPKMEQRFFSDHYGFISDYLAEALRSSRRQNYSSAVDEEFAFGEHLNARDERAVRKTVSGLLKILHPHGEWTRAELREYLELALEGRRRIKEQLKKLAPHEYSKTAFSYVERDTGMEFWVEVPEQPDSAITETISNKEADAAIPRKLQARATESRRLSVEELMALGESSTVEFKSSARWNLHKGDRDQAIEREIVKAVSGFMNAHGGTLLIGVNDSHEAVGLEQDYKLTKKGNRDPRDSFENWLTDLFDNSIGRPVLANVSITFEEVDEHDVCRIEVRPSRQPVYARGKQTMDFYVRLNNGTRSLNIEDAVAYI
ncbi:MAG: protease Lon-related BREX system protein BrxL, partial [Actinomycetota bacterium]|nr:protease Lon-related BREX system protein BrxL [Actinomycetota bacterium]